MSDLKRLFIRAFIVVMVPILVLAAGFHLNTVAEKISESIQYYSTSDMAAYNAGVWLRNNFPGPKRP